MMPATIKILKTAIFLIMIPASFVTASAAEYREYLQKADKQMAALEYKEAIKNYRKAFRANDKNSDVYRGLAACHEKMGYPDSAKYYYEGAIVFNPKDIDSYQKIGDLFYNERDFHEAMSWYERGMDLGRLYPSSYQKLGIIHLRWHELRKAREYFEKVIEIDSTFADGYFGMGLTLLQAGDTLEASSFIVKSASIGTEPKAFYFLGLLAFIHDQPDSALVNLNHYLKQEPAGEYSPKAESLISRIKAKK
jgi:Tfp pilus assembly protein PilF